MKDGSIYDYQTDPLLSAGCCNIDEETIELFGDEQQVVYADESIDRVVPAYEAPLSVVHTESMSFIINRSDSPQALQVDSMEELRRAYNQKHRHLQQVQHTNHSFWQSSARDQPYYQGEFE